MQRRDAPKGGRVRSQTSGDATILTDKLIPLEQYRSEVEVPLALLDQFITENRRMGHVVLCVVVH